MDIDAIIERVRAGGGLQGSTQISAEEFEALACEVERLRGRRSLQGDPALVDYRPCGVCGCWHGIDRDCPACIAEGRL